MPFAMASEVTLGTMRSGGFQCTVFMLYDIGVMHGPDANGQHRGAKGPFRGAEGNTEHVVGDARKSGKDASRKP